MLENFTTDIATSFLKLEWKCLEKHVIGLCHFHEYFHVQIQACLVAAGEELVSSVLGTMTSRWRNRLRVEV